MKTLPLSGRQPRQRQVNKYLVFPLISSEEREVQPVLGHCHGTEVCSRSGPLEDCDRVPEMLLMLEKLAFD